MAERVWSEKDLVRRAKRRLAVLQHAEEVSGSVAATCRYYGISRTVRHSSVAAMRRAGVPDRVVAEWHGHSESVMINTYGRHTEPNELTDAGAALSAALA